MIMRVTCLLFLGPFLYIALYWGLQNYETHCKQLFHPFWPYLPSSSLTKTCFCHNTVQSGFWFLLATFFHWLKSTKTLIWLVVNVGGRIPKVSGKSPTSFPKIIFGDNHKRRRKFRGSHCAVCTLKPTQSAPWYLIYQVDLIFFFRV